MDQEPTGELDLRGYVRVLRRRKWVVAAVPAFALSVALVLAGSQTPRYRGSAEVLLAPQSAEILLSAEDLRVPQDTSRYIATEVKVLTSEAVEALANERLGYSAKVTASSSPDDNVVTVSAVDDDADRAAQTANAFVRAYIDYRRETRVQDSLNAQTVIQQKIDEKRSQLAALDGTLSQLPVAQRDSAAAAQAAERTSLTSQEDLFRSQLDRLQVGAGLDSGGAQPLTAAVPPSAPFEPNPLRSGILALLAGTMIGVALAFLLDYLDDSLRSKDDLERVTGGLPVLGIIPALSGWRDVNQTRTVTLTNPTSVGAEAYRSLRASVQFLALDAPLQTLQLTSPSSSEGKTTTVANLAVALATAGQRVIVIDCDLRRARLHKFFDLPNTVGFTSVLLGDLPLSAALQQVGDNDRLHLLASGPRPPNPSELLSGTRALEVLAAVRAEADIVLLDTPPVLPVSDAVVLSARVDATLLVANARATSGKSLRRAFELLRQVDAPIIGTVLNGASGEDTYGYAYGYTYGQSPREGADPSPVSVPAPQ